jgi:solute:Na+ symporter, SSS family
MNFQTVDWLIIVVLLGGITAMAWYTKRFSKSVADFLAANRCAGRYLLTMSEAMQGIGAISVVALFQIYYRAGFTAIWWKMMLMPAIIAFLGLSGFIIYRYRQTRAMTMAQFFEMRYSRNFRVFAGIICFISGIVNFGIFPAVGARFFIHFCGLPQTVSVVGIDIGTYPLMMILLLIVPLYFVFMGGQIAVMVTDFIQGMFNNIAFIVILIVIAMLFKWSQISEVLLEAPKGASMVNPFDTLKLKDFNALFFMMEISLYVYGYMAWQGNQANNVSAKTPHEARMGKILSAFRMVAYFMVIFLVPVCAYTYMHHPDFSMQAAEVQQALDQIGHDGTIKEMQVPLAMINFLPVGVIGLFAAVMLAAFISTHDTYLHSWGSIFIQDVILPFRKKPFDPKQHLLLLRLSIFGVAVFIFFFSLFFQLNQYIYMFQMITGSIWLGGAGSVLIGGLYWKRGTTAAAWSALILGAVLSVAGLILTNSIQDFPLNSMHISFLSAAACILLYVLVSLFGKKIVFDIDRMLHRGKYAVKDDIAEGDHRPVGRIRKALGMGKEFTRGDKIIYLGALSWIALWVVVFIFGTIYNLTHKVRPESWLTFWHIYVYFSFAMAVVVTVWFTIGGVRDMRDLFRALAVAGRDVSDDGHVRDHDVLLHENEGEPDKKAEAEITIE